MEQKVDDLRRRGGRLSQRNKRKEKKKEKDQLSNMRNAFSLQRHPISALVYVTVKLCLWYFYNWWSVLNKASSIVIHFAVYFDPERFIAAFLLFNYRSDYSFNYAGFFFPNQSKHCDYSCTMKYLNTSIYYWVVVSDHSCAYWGFHGRFFLSPFRQCQLHLLFFIYYYYFYIMRACDYETVT